MPRREPIKSPKEIPNEKSHSAMRHPPTPAKGGKMRTKSLHPAAMRKPWEPSLPPHALARKRKPTTDHPSKATETIRKEKHVPPPIEESRKRRKRKQDSLSMSPKKHAPIAPKRSSSPNDNPLTGKNLRGRKSANCRMTLTHLEKWDQTTEVERLRTALPPPPHLPALIAVRFLAHRRN